MIWTIANHTDADCSVTLEVTGSRSWPLAKAYWGIDVPPDTSVHFLIPSSVPDTAAAGDVSLLAQVHLDGDTTTLDRRACVIPVMSAPAAGIPVVIVSDLVRVEWSTWLHSNDCGIVEVQRDGRGWVPDGSVTADIAGRCAFEDRSVTPGSTVDYRLRATSNGLTMVSAVATVHVPERTPLAIAGLRPNPSRVAPVVAFTLPERAVTRLEVYDVAGRRVYARDLGALAPGPHMHTLESSGALPSGVCVFRLTSGGRSVSARGVIAR
jgi:hypothetical protein